MTLADLRRAVSLTQDEVAQACGVSKTTVSAWERGAAVPRPRHIRALADVLHTSIKEVQDVIESQKNAAQDMNPAR
jgi:putative transcriptional regulator